LEPPARWANDSQAVTKPVAQELDRILDSEYLGDVAARPLEEVRSMRAECQAVETGLSYLRRLVQGRLDIVNLEIRRRDEGGESDLAALVAELPEVLADRTRAPGNGRLPQQLEPAEVDSDLDAQLAAIVADHDVESLPSLSSDELTSVRDQLETFEREVSDRRRALFSRIDALQAELTRRYRTGEASVESLLQ
jgi:hypothetical protein